MVGYRRNLKIKKGGIKLLTESINFNRSEQRFTIISGKQNRIILESPVELQEIKYSDNPINRTVYIGEEDLVPWGVSFKARKYLPEFSPNDFTINYDETYAFSIKKVLDKETETSKKSPNLIINLKKAIDITSTEIGKQVGIYLITEYNRQHFISSDTNLRITWDKETSYWKFQDKPIFLYKEKLERVEIKVSTDMLTDTKIIKLIEVILNNRGKSDLSKKETGFVLIKQK